MDCDRRSRRPKTDGGAGTNARGAGDGPVVGEVQQIFPVGGEVAGRV